MCKLAWTGILVIAISIIIGICILSSILYAVKKYYQKRKRRNYNNNFMYQNYAQNPQ